MNPDAILFGAFERHNFGDLLMGFAFERLLSQKGVKTIHASILDNDLSPYGGTRVHSIFSLLANGMDPDIPILHVGGETGSCTFLEALACDSPTALPFHLKDIISHEVHQKLGTDRPFPYLTPPKERINQVAKTWGNRLFYGIGLSKLPDDNGQKEDLKATLAAARLISFRDANSLSHGRSIGIAQATYAPDIVLSIGQLMPVTRPMEPDYLLMHFKGDYLRRNAADLIQALSQVAPRFNGGLKLGVAGTASYHDSLDDYYWFKKLAEEADVFIEVLPSVDILTICQQIAKAAAVISTSLHYRIVARAYGVPRLTMNVHKVNGWSDSNDAIYPFGVEPGQLAVTLEAMMGTEWPVDDTAQTQDLAIIDHHLEVITEIIKSAPPEPNRHEVSAPPPQPGAPSPDLWFDSMVRCFDERDSSIRTQAETIKAQDAVLSSKSRLLWRLLRLLLPSVRPIRESAAPSHSQSGQKLRSDPPRPQEVRATHGPLKSPG